MTPRRSLLVLAVLALALGAVVLAYHGPGRSIVRGHVGDVAAAMLVFALVSIVAVTVARGPVRVVPRALVTLGIAAAIEVAQLWWHASSTVGHLTLGATFDPWDLVAYVAGTAIAVAWDRRAIAWDAGRC